MKPFTHRLQMIDLLNACRCRMRGDPQHSFKMWGTWTTPLSHFKCLCSHSDLLVSVCVDAFKSTPELHSLCSGSGCFCTEIFLFRLGFCERQLSLNSPANRVTDLTDQSDRMKRGVCGAAELKNGNISSLIFWRRVLIKTHNMNIICFKYKIQSYLLFSLLLLQCSR